MVAVVVTVSLLCIQVDLADFTFPDNQIFLDRSGKTLRFFPDSQGERHLWISYSQIPEKVKNAFIAAEDNRFFNHKGYDFLAITRALIDNIKSDRIVSGASTITQQLIK